MITAFCDGACRGGNPGNTSCAFVVYDGDKEIHRQGKVLPGKQTNNFSEYTGLIELLMFLRKSLYNGLPLTRVLIFCDSMLVVNQVNQEWPVKADSLRDLNALAYALKIQGKHVLQHVHGHDGILGNEVADQICNTVLDAAENETNDKEDKGMDRTSGKNK